MRQQNIDKIRAECGVAGRPIRLADVLLVIHKKHPRWKPVNWLKRVSFVTSPFYIVSWTLNQDNLVLQSDETLQFIADLLPTKQGSV